MSQLSVQGVCLFCGKNVLMSHGLKLKDIYICSCCEKDIKELGAENYKYDFYVRGLKKIWCCAV